MLVSAAEGIVVRNLTVSRAGELGSSGSSTMALCRVNRGLDRASLDVLDLETLETLVLAVLAEPELSFLELDKFESWDVFLVTIQLDALRLGSRSRMGIPQ